MSLRAITCVLLLCWLLTGCGANPAAPAVRITAAGDYGASAAAAGVLAEVGRIDPDAHVALGDLSYGQLGSEDAWCDFVREHTGGSVPFELLAGNHDSGEDSGGDIARYASCLPNELPGLVGDYGRQYYVDLPAEEPVVRMILASPGLVYPDGPWEYRSGDERYSWVADAIDGARASGLWVVVAAHKPCQSLGVHTCPEVSDFYDLMVERDVDLVLHGHEHSYARTHQLAASPACPSVPVDRFEPGCVADSDSQFRSGAGTVFATAGTGGIEIRENAADDPEGGYFAATSAAGNDPAHGLIELDIDERSLRASFVATDGSFRDEFTIDR